METTDQPTSRSARQFVMMGVQLQEALKSGNAIDASLDAFCREAFARKDLAQSITFLLSLVDKNVARLAELLKVRHLVAELSVGSQILSSLVAAQWDKVEQTDRLAQLADGILAAHQQGTNLTNSGEFSAALAKTIAVLHPDRAKALLQMAEPTLSGPENESMLREAWDWQRAGELLSSKDMEFRKFWHQTLRQQRGDWFWDTAEGRRALSGLDSGNEDLNVRGGLFRRSVPAWAWKPGDALPEVVPASERAASAPPSPQQPTVSTAPTVAPVADNAPQSNRGSSFVLIGSLAILGCAAVVVAATRIDFSRLLPSPPQSPQTVAEVIAQPVPKLQTSIASVAPVAALSGPALLASQPPPPAPMKMAQVTPLPAQLKPITTAQLVPASITSRNGWVKTPLGNEFQVTPANASAGKITDEQGRVWGLPADPCLVAEMKNGNQVINPYNGEITPLNADELKPGRTIPYAATGWTFTLPTTLLLNTTSKPAAAETPLVPVPKFVKAPAATTAVVATSSASEPTPEAKSSSNVPQDATGAITRSLSILATSPVPPPTAATAPKPEEAAPTPLPAKMPMSDRQEEGKAAAGSPGPQTAPPPAPGKPPAHLDSGASKPSGLKPVKEVVKRPPGLPSKSVSKSKLAAKKHSSSGKMIASRLPAPTAQRKATASVPSASTRQQLVFVTRANSIRMNYKGGYWESLPGAYLSGAGHNPTDWARDMTLRERSSGTIPQGYMFKVVDQGVVRVLPEPPRR